MGTATDDRSSYGRNDHANDGSFGSTTVQAYRKWQLRCGYSGKDADSIPGKDSLTRLGKKYGFTVK
ncbi:hypothetical protein ABZV93_28385 [Actinopolymorpha sp. NPDC004070]|uniref:hypothetical protein n=1 Tax=Actinopolymorpha sp. NPDC004070 TaxID=3154548 RepID=UPI0033AD8DB2